VIERRNQLKGECEVYTNEMVDKHRVPVYSCPDLIQALLIPLRTSRSFIFEPESSTCQGRTDKIPFEMTGLDSATSLSISTKRDMTYTA
jgi:hypothetical protein